MDLYTQTAMTSTRHSDLLREADNARLAATGETGSRFEAVRRSAAHLRARLEGVTFRSRKPVIAPQQG
jgi:hypothetical protein